MTFPPHAPIDSGTVCGLTAGEYGALIASRICHDLISPVGAVNNGVELLAELGGAAGEAELALIETSAAMAAASLEFQRIAFGAAGANDMLALTSLHRTAARWFAHQKPQLEWLDPAGDISRAGGRLLMNLLQIAASCLPRGGAVQVRGGADPLRVEVVAAGPRAAPAEGAADWLEGRAAATAPAPRDAHYLAAYVHACAAGGRVRMTVREEEIVLAVEAA